MTDAELWAVRKQFCDHILAHWAVLDGSEPDADAANQHLRAAEQMVEQWTAQKTVRDTLLPLIEDDNPQIRWAAASYLLRNGATEAARTELEGLANSDEIGLVASSAEAVLMSWEQEGRKPKA
ncbi:HEAT repeat-containing protein [Amycolatopsis marina]|uniref:HEAT repeat-containing protein n=1 Tax=Amycolatopsis marina TaxID=490629 RepID=A0A1I0Z317_9PSEU|nr:HEAT repeat domain-containing protein [Amycolatopsis marina]SFB19717.1 HEAT repeat-containing protein [Amycolatopsis marina]